MGKNIKYVNVKAINKVFFKAQKFKQSSTPYILFRGRVWWWRKREERKKLIPVSQKMNQTSKKMSN